MATGDPILSSQYYIYINADNGVSSIIYYYEYLDNEATDSDVYTYNLNSSPNCIVGDDDKEYWFTVTCNDGYEIDSITGAYSVRDNIFSVQSETTVTITTKATETSGGTSMSSVEVAYIQYKDGTKLDAIKINGTKYKFTDYDAVRIEGEETKYKITTSSDTYDSVLNNNSWAQISAASSAGLASSLWSVGDLHSVEVSGTIGTSSVSGTYYAYILGFNHNSTYEGDNLIHFGTFKTALTDGVDVCLIASKYEASYTSGVKYFNINHWSVYHYGGWKGSDIRYDILGSTDIAPSDYGSAVTSSRTGYDASTTCATNPVIHTFMAALESDLRAVMKPITKYTDNVAGGSDSVLSDISSSVDYLPLLAEYEILGVRIRANTYEQNYQEQYEYYANGNSTLKYKHSETSSAAVWWSRSPCYENASFYCFTGSQGTSGYGSASISYGLACAFAV